MSSAVVALHVLVSGRVQGVGYRMWCARRAEAIGLGGWVRNRPDGTVEGMLCGETGKVDVWLAEARIGPPMAEVAAVVTRAATAAERDLYKGQGTFLVLPGG